MSLAEPHRERMITREKQPQDATAPAPGAEFVGMGS